MLSINLTTNTFSKLTDIKVFYYEEEFATIGDIVRSNMPIYAYNTTRQDNIDEVKILLNKSRTVKHLPECLRKIQAGEKIICVGFRRRAWKEVMMEMENTGKRSMKISKFSFHHDNTVIAFEKTSPFVHKFNQLIQRVIESGIDQAWMSNIKSLITILEKRRLKDRLDNIIKDTLFIQLIFILSIGNFLSTIVFILELSLPSLFFKV